MEISEKVGTACKLYQYITKIIIILFIPTLLCFSGVPVDFSKNGYFDLFLDQKVGFGGYRIIRKGWYHMQVLSIYYKGRYRRRGITC